MLPASISLPFSYKTQVRKDDWGENVAQVQKVIVIDTRLIRLMSTSQVVEIDHFQVGSWMGRMLRPTPGPGRSHSESTVATSVEDHWLTVTGSSLLLTVWIEIRDQVATLSLWVSYCKVSANNVSLSHCLRDSLYRIKKLLLPYAVGILHLLK